MLAGLAVGTGRIGALNAARVMLGGAFPVLVVVLYLGGQRQSASFFYAWTFTSVVSAALLGLRFRRVWSRASLRVVLEQWRVGVPVHVSNVGQRILLRGDQFLLVALASTAAVGQYSVAVNVAETLWYLPVAAGLASLPILSGSGSPAFKRHELRRALRVSFLFTLLGAAGLAVAAPMAVPWFPEDVPLVVELGDGGPGVMVRRGSA